MRTISASRMRYIIEQTMAARDAQPFRNAMLDLAITWLMEAAVSDVAVETAPVVAVGAIETEADYAAKSGCPDGIIYDVELAEAA
jgi:hypothetical protein